jgi:hypothetical protein
LTDFNERMYIVVKQLNVQNKYDIPI